VSAALVSWRAVVLLTGGALDDLTSCLSLVLAGFDFSSEGASSFGFDATDVVAKPLAGFAAGFFFFAIGRLLNTNLLAS
jgi:hypothetical protein